MQSLTRRVGESEERCSLLQEQADSLKELLLTDKEQYSQKELMYKQNVGPASSTRTLLFVARRPKLHAVFVLDPDVQGHHHSERPAGDGGQPEARAGALQAGSQV